jgi:predicted P-loop ATPase
MRDELARSDGDDVDEPIAEHEFADKLGRVAPAADAWKEHLVRKEVKHQVVTSCTAPNVAVYLRYHPAWKGCVVYDEFREDVITTRVPPWCLEDAHAQIAPGPWTDLDTGRLVAWLARNEGLEMPVGEVERGLQTAADTARVHPVREYLRGLRWDGVARIDSWLHDLLGAEAGPYASGVGSRWLISAVARVMRPGCQVDCTLILEGATGAGKTSVFRNLVPVREWYSDTPLDLSNKDSLDALRSVWIYGLDELDSLRKGEVTRIKNFLTQTRDRYRPPYGRRVRDYVRQNVFAGTTNEDEYLIDRTGNRRFWPVRVADVIDWGRIAAVRDQLWAEAFVRFEAGAAWHVDTQVLRVLCTAQQQDRTVVHPWVEIVRRWLAQPTQLELEDGRSYRSPFDVAKGVTTMDVLVHAVGMPRKDCDTRHAMQAAAALRENGWAKSRVCVDGSRTPRFFPPPPQPPEPDDIDRGE